MKRELKEQQALPGRPAITLIAKHIPMKRELKEHDARLLTPIGREIAKHIPMKRELKARMRFAVCFVVA